MDDNGRSDWQWPGSRWWRVDLHAHSPASHDFGSEDDRARPNWAAWVAAARDAGLHAVAVTDHNTAAGIAPLQQAAAAVERSPVLFPGVEVTANDGVHLLMLMDPTRTRQHVEDFLSHIELPVDGRGMKDARSPLSVEQILDACPDDAMVIGAHVNLPGGLLEHDGQQRIAELIHPLLAAVEVVPDFPVDESWIDGRKPEIGRSIPRLWSSDSHRLDQFGRRCTWIKMTRPDAEGLRLALLDGADSLRPAAAGAAADPNLHAASAIESIIVHKAKYLGRSQPLQVPFNPWFNTIIGRGAGKSTLVDFCRTTLRREAELGRHDELQRAFRQRLQVPRARGDEGLLTDATTIRLIYRKDGARFELAWNRGGSAPAIARCDGDARIPEDGDIRERFPVRIYSQKQLFEYARNPDALLAVIDETGTVDGAALRRRSEELDARYLALRAEARALRAAAANLPARNAALSDVRRKLSMLQTGAHAAARETSSALVRIAIDADGDRRSLPAFLRTIMGIAHFDQDHRALAKRIDPHPQRAWTWRALDRTLEQLHAVVAGAGSWNTQDARFERALKRLQPERLDRLGLYVPDDAVSVSFRDQRQPGRPWKPLAHGSPGQQTAALLAFVLGYGVEPIILDQPEDDLDSTLIYELLVRRLREQKARRQIIVVTHNPNIVVHGARSWSCRSIRARVSRCRSVPAVSRSAW